MLPRRARITTGAYVAGLGMAVSERSAPRRRSSQTSPSEDEPLAKRPKKRTSVFSVSSVRGNWDSCVSDIFSANVDNQDLCRTPPVSSAGPTRRVRTGLQAPMPKPNHEMDEEPSPEVKAARSKVEEAKRVLRAALKVLVAAEKRDAKRKELRASVAKYKKLFEDATTKLTAFEEVEVVVVSQNGGGRSGNGGASGGGDGR